jgi:hypothetical protein
MIKKIFLALIGIVIAILFYYFPAPSDRMLNIQNYLITVGGIISAILISYLASKIFNIRNERENRLIEIRHLSEKLTYYRRLLYYIMRSREFWVHFKDTIQYKKDFPGLNYDILHGQGKENRFIIKSFWGEENKLCTTTIDLYCAMEKIQGDVESDNGLWCFDKGISFIYSSEEIINFYDPSNQIWYYLEGRFGKYGYGKFNDTGISPAYIANSNIALIKIDSKYKESEVSREIIAQISADFYEIYLPRLQELTIKNKGIPKNISKTFYNLLLIIIFGVLVPLVIQSINVKCQLNIWLTLSSVWITSMSLIKFIFDFSNIIYEEIHFNDKL